MIRRRGDGLELATLADSAEPWHGAVRVERVGFDGTVLAATDIALALEPRTGGVAPLPSGVATPADPRAELLVVRAEGVAVVHFWFADDIDAALPPPLCDVDAAAVADGYAVTVTARTLVKDLALLTDRIDPEAVVDDMLVTLLPGESARLHVRSTRDLAAAAFAAPPVLRCANDLLWR